MPAASIAQGQGKLVAMTVQGAAAMFGCNTYAYMMSESAASCIARLADRGFAEFELMVHPLHLWPSELSVAQRSALRGLIAGRGLQLTTLNIPNIDINIASTVPEMRRYSLDLLAETVRLAGDLGARGVIISPGRASPLFPAPEDELTGYFYAALDRLCPLAAACGTAMWIENVPTTWNPTIAGLLASLDRYGSDAVRIIYDVANAYFIGEDFSDGLRQCRERLELVHLSDTGRTAFRHDPVGEGSVPFAEVPAALAAVGYAARPMLEIISRDPDRDIIASAERLAALGFKPGVT
jgi:sugar phosphate isomerase/epimerase